MKEYSEKIKGINLLLAPILYIIMCFVYSDNAVNSYIKILIEFATVLFVLVYLCKIKEIDIRTFIKCKNLKYVLLGLVLLRVIPYIGTYLGKIIMHEERIANDMALINMINQLEGIGLIKFYFSTIIFGPILEEYVYRYVIVGNLGKMSKISIVISSAIFSTMHLSTNIIHWLTFFLMGMVLAITYRKTERIEISMIIHILNNLLAFIGCI